MKKKHNNIRSKQNINREIQQAKSDSNYPGGAYKLRDHALRELGFLSYGDYLSSDIWRGIRRRVYTQHGRRCYICHEKATELHHNSYCKPVLEGTTIKFIYPLCHECHVKIEFRDGRKQSMVRVVGSFWSLYLSHFESDKKQIQKTKPDKPKKGGQFFCPCGQRRKHNRPLCRKCGGWKGHWKNLKKDDLNKPRSYHFKRSIQTRQPVMTELERIISLANHANDWKKRNKTPTGEPQ